jgi:hypothetical protein
MSLVQWWPLNQGNLNNLIDITNPLIQTNASDNELAVAGKLGTSVRNNSKASGTLRSTKTFNLGHQQSMFCWLYLEEVTSDSALSAVMGQHRYANPCGLGVTIRYISSTQGYLSVNIGSRSYASDTASQNSGYRSYNVLHGGTVLTTGKWYHVGYTYDHGLFRLYVNGKPESLYWAGTPLNTTEYSNSHTIDANIVTDYFGAFMWSFYSATIGNTAIYGGYISKSRLNDIRLYDHALSKKEVKELSRGLMLSFGFDGRPLDYLEFTGTQYINTEVAQDAKWEFDMQWVPNGQRQLMGYQGSSGQYWGITANGYYEIYASSGVLAGERDLITHYFNEDGRCELVIEGKGKVGAGGPVSGYSYHIGALQGGVNCCFKLYRCRCISGGRLIRDFVPWERNGIKGLMDVKNNKFYSNAGTGVFGGPVSNSNHLVVNGAGYPYTTVTRGTLSYDTPVGDYSMACTGSWHGWADTSLSTGATWNDAVYVRTDLGFTMTPTEFTIEWWYKPLSEEHNGSWINLSRDATNSGSYDNNASTLSDYDTTWKVGGARVNSTVHRAEGWHHYVLVAKNGGQAHLYRDGQKVSSNTLTTAMGPFRYVIIGNGEAGGVVRPTRGWFGNFKLFMTALEDTEIQELYTNRLAIDPQGRAFTAVLHEGSDKFQSTRKSITNCNQLIESLSLPKEYLPLDGIYFNRSTYILTDLIINNSSLSINVAADITPTITSGNSCVMGCGNSLWYGPIFLNCCTNFLEAGVNGYGDNRNSTAGTFTNSERFVYHAVIHKDKQTYFKNGVPVLGIPSRALVATTYALCIGGFNTSSGGLNSNDNFLGWIHSVNIQYGSTVMKMVPCKRKSDGKLGMFDTVSGKFFAATGTSQQGPQTLSQGRDGKLYASGVVES